MSVVTLIGTSDVHGHTENLPLLGGYLANLPNPYLLLDAGDFISGTLECLNSKGQIMVEAYNKLDYAAVAPGNHDFDYGLAAFEDLAKNARFEVLTCNVFERGSLIRPWWARPWCIFVRGGKAIAVIGATTQETIDLSSDPGLKQSLDFRLIETHVEREVSIIREHHPEVSAIVLLVHKGIPTKGGSQKLKKLANNLTGVVDAIVGGHTHGMFYQIVNGIPIIQSGCVGSHFGRIDLLFEQALLIDAVVHAPQEIKQGDYEGKPVQEDKELKASLSPYMNTEGRVLTKTAVQLPLNQDKIQELDYVLADLFLVGTKLRDASCEIAFLNKGSIRAALPEGAIRYGHLFNAMPFSNTVVKVEMAGYDLERLMKVYKEELIPSGIEWDKKTCKIPNKLWSLGRTYVVAMSDYLASLLQLESVSIYWEGKKLPQLEAIVDGARSFYKLPRVLASRVKK